MTAADARLGRLRGCPQFPEGSAILFTREARRSMRPVTLSDGALLHLVPVPTLGPDRVYTARSAGRDPFRVTLSETGEVYQTIHLMSAEGPGPRR